MTVTNTVLPAITGTAKQGQTLHTTNGTWTFDLDYLTYSYQWLRCDAAGANCSPIGGATNANYLVQSADIGSTLRSEVTATEHAGSTPPPGAYFLSDWSSGLFAYQAGDATKPWATLFSYTAPGYLDCGYYGGPARTGTADGRMSIVANPYGAGFVMRSESRDTDPGWPVVTTLSKSEVSAVKNSTWPNGNFVLGAEIWITLEIYLPDEFSLASGGSNPFTEICGLHPSSGSGVSALEIANQPGNYLQLHYGQYPGNDHFFNLIPLNDGSYRNRLIPVVLGAKIHDTSGWAEAWVDGVNVLTRQNLPMASATESGPYWKQGIYTGSDCLFTGGSVNGRSIIYFGTTALYSARPF